MEKFFLNTLFLPFFAASLLFSQNDDSQLVNELNALVTAQVSERPSATLKIAKEIHALPDGILKVKAADALAQIVLRNDPGATGMETVADALRESLLAFPVNGNHGEPAPPYMDLARLIRYEHAGTAIDDQRFAHAMQMLAAEDHHVEATDFTLKDLQDKSYTRSQLRGKVVMVNFWASWCAPCLLEMPDIEDLYARLKSKGLVVLAISNEDEATVRAAAAHYGFKMPVLLDPDAGLGQSLGIDGLPRTYVFNREGKLVAASIDQCSRRQFVQMLGEAGLHP